MKIKEGSLVKIINNGKSYTTYTDWFEDNGIDSSLWFYYNYNVPPKEYSEDNRIYKVLEKHENICLLSKNKCTVFTEELYLVHVDGLELVIDNEYHIDKLLDTSDGISNHAIVSRINEIIEIINKMNSQQED